MAKTSLKNRLLTIGSDKIGDGQPAWVIAEAGVNHNGDMSLAIELVHAAKESGADCVKFQTFKADDLVSKSSPKAKYQLETTDPKQSQYEMLKALELKVEDFARLKEECDKLKICFLSTPYNTWDVDLLEEIGTSAYKIASAMSVEPHLLRHVAKTGKPILLSTGMCTMDEVSSTVNTLIEAGNEQVLLFQCTTDYPSRVEDVNLNAMAAIAETTGVLTGYSDHCESFTASIAAVALGACAIERHFTLDKTMLGPDHQASSSPEEFSTLVKSIREVELAKGVFEKVPSPREYENKVAMRRGIVAAADLRAGTIISESHLAYKRPLQGVPPSEYEKLLGKTLKNDLNKNAPFDWDVLA